MTDTTHDPIQRYSAYHSGDPSQIGLWPDPEGYWLRYADHARIVGDMEQAHAAALAEPDFSPQRDDESDREYLSRSIGRCAVTFDPKRGQNATAEAPDESRGHRVFTGEQSVTFDGKPNDPYRPATSVEADAIEAQAAEFLKPLLDVIVPSRHARTCGIWRITAAVARCTCRPNDGEATP